MQLTRYIHTLICLLFFLVAGSQLVQARSILIENVNLINPVDYNRVEQLGAHWVLISDGQIKSISKQIIPQHSIADSEIQIIDGSGQYLIPGLMDSHVHTGQMPGLTLNSETAALQKAYLKQEPLNYLYYGVTHILDPSKTAFQANKFNSLLIRPDMRFCGAAPILNGYNAGSWNINILSRKRPHFIYQPGIDPKDGLHFDPANHTPEAVIARLAQEGATCIKVYIENGFNHADHWPILPKAMLERVKKAANQHNLIVFAHANASDMQTIALDAEVDIIGHGMWNWLDHHSEKGLPPGIKQIADRIIQTGTWFQPTLNVMRALRDVTVPGHLEHQAYQWVLSPQAISWYKSKAGQWFSREMKSGWGTDDLARIHQGLNRSLNRGERVMQYLYQRGHPLLLASDAPPAPTYASQPGLSTNWEMKHMHRLGVSLPHLLASATINNAKAFGIQDQYGSITIGKRANLLLLNANPLETIEAYDQIDLVIVGGQSFKRSALKLKH